PSVSLLFSHYNLVYRPGPVLDYRLYPDKDWMIANLFDVVLFAVLVLGYEWQYWYQSDDVTAGGPFLGIRDGPLSRRKNRQRGRSRILRICVGPESDRSMLNNLGLQRGASRSHDKRRRERRGTLS